MFATRLLGRKSIVQPTKTSHTVGRTYKGNNYKNGNNWSSFRQSSTVSQSIPKSSSSNFGVLLGIAAATAAVTTTFIFSTATAKEEEKKEEKEEEKEEEPKKALNSKEFKEFTLIETEKYNHNSYLYRFKLEDDEILGMDVASCLVVKAPIGPEGKPVIRPYTPISSNDEKGYFDLLIKEYPGGVMSKHLTTLKPGDKLEVKGPIPKIAVKPNFKKEIGMIAGGTGVTPMYQVANELLKHSEDNTKITLIFANVTDEDILLRGTLDKLAKEHKNFTVHYFLDKPSKDWKGESGFLTPEKAKKLLPAPKDDNLIMVCGPPGMMKAYSGEKAKDYSQGEVGGLLKDLGYTKEQVFKF